MPCRYIMNDSSVLIVIFSVSIMIRTPFPMWTFVIQYLQFIVCLSSFINCARWRRKDCSFQQLIRCQSNIHYTIQWCLLFDVSYASVSPILNKIWNNYVVFLLRLRFVIQCVQLIPLCPLHWWYYEWYWSNAN